jgi:N-acetyl-anhydromuramoyl-L-alanine amidase
MIRRGFDVVPKGMAVRPSAQSVRIDANTGLVLGVRQVLTDHYDARPAGVVPDLVIVHGISLPPAQFGGPWIDRLFTGSLPAEVHPYFAAIAAGRVSAHALIRRDGEIVQYVPFAERAWHAGRSEYQGRAACNDFSIGIELEGTDDTAYEAAQYESLSALIRALLAAYPTLSRERVVGHSDVAPGRKSDPGDSFDWGKLRAAI